MRKLLVGTLAFVLAALPVWSQQVEYYHLDALGSVRAVTDGNGEILTRHDYFPYGEEWEEPATSDPRRFTGKERDPETGLDYFGARYYVPGTARFASVDPVTTWEDNLADPQRWNRYAYVRNNPLRYTDPDGRVLVPVLLGAWAVFEVASTAYDAYTAYQTVTDPTSSQAAKAVAVGGLILGVATVGGGYGTAGKEVLEHTDKAANLVYRGLAAGEDTAGGLIARAPGIGNSPASHVAGARRSQWISTTRDPKIARDVFGEHGVVEIDLSKVSSTVVNVSNGIPGLPPNSMLSNWARKSQEVLIQDAVPAAAVRRVQ